MLSAKTAHELQLSLYNFAICCMYYKITVFKMAWKDCFWLLSYGIREIPPTYLSVSLCTFSNHWPTAVTFERVKILKIIKLLNVLWNSVAEERMFFITFCLGIAGGIWLLHVQGVCHRADLKSAAALQERTWGITRA